MVGLWSLMIAFVAYLAIAYVAVKLTTDKLFAHSSAFGLGIANLLVGFVGHYIAVDELTYHGYYMEEYTSPWYYVICFGLLVLGLSGIVLMAVDLLRGINAVARSALGEKSDSEK